MAQRNPAVRAAERRALARLLQGGRRYASMAARRVRGFAGRNPQTTAFGVGAAAQVAYSARKGSKRKRMKKGISRGRKIPRKAGGGKPPTQPSSRVTAKYAVADRMTKFKKVKATSKQKVPKTVGAHYKEYGAYQANGCMYINHEHWGSYDKFWHVIGLALTKQIMAKGRVYPGKLHTEPMIGPRTALHTDQPAVTRDNTNVGDILQLHFATENDNGNLSVAVSSFNILDYYGASADRYKSLEALANEVANDLKLKYDNQGGAIPRQYLRSAQIIQSVGGNVTQALPVTVMNLDDAEICVYVKSLIKLQNVTKADHSDDVTSAAYSKDAIDANPLEGRIYTSSGRKPKIDDDLLAAGENRSLDTYFGTLNTSGISLLGTVGSPAGTTHNPADLAAIRHIPGPRELYNNVNVSSGRIYMGVGAMKYHKTSFTFRATFKQLSFKMMKSYHEQGADMIAKHTLFGFTQQHKHGEETIELGFNRETDASCMIKFHPKVWPVRTNYTDDQGIIDVPGAMPGDLPPHA